jgi:ATP-binding protein involved in chromosome partitioning
METFCNYQHKKWKGKAIMRIAIPVSSGRLSPHFGHCEEFTLIDVDAESGNVTGQETVKAPPHEPGLLPRWLHERGANVIVAGGMGMRAQQLFAENNIQVIVGVSAGEPAVIVDALIKGQLISGENLCDH